MNALPACPASHAPAAQEKAVAQSIGSAAWRFIAPRIPGRYIAMIMNANEIALAPQSGTRVMRRRKRRGGMLLRTDGSGTPRASKEGHHERAL